MRFSAREAFIMAIGVGMRMPTIWRACEIGKPTIVLRGDLKRWLKAQGLGAHVSESDETDYAAGVGVAEQSTLP